MPRCHGFPEPAYPPSREEGRSLCRRRSTALFGEDASSESAPLVAASSIPTQQCPSTQQQHLAVCWDASGLTGCAHRQYSKLLRCHWQWFLSSAASSLIGRLTLFPRQRSVCLLYSQVIVYKRIIYKNMLLRTDFNFKKTTTAHCSVPILKRPSDEAGPSH